MATTEQATPWFLRGGYAPVTTEVDSVDLLVDGVLPPALEGTYVRNGPNPLGGSPHWFVGDGMLHGIRLRGGRAERYRNRFVRTKALEGAQLVGADGTVDLSVGVSNTHVIHHAGRLLALVESSWPCEVTADLDTIGPTDLGGLTTAMTAHPKTDPVTGELLFFGAGFLPPYLTYHRLSATGELVESRQVEVPGPTMHHDFNITHRSAIFMDLPVVFDLDLAMHGAFPYRWDDGYPSRFGVLPRAGGDVRWYDVDPCYVFHPANAWEDEQGRITIDACRYDDLWRGGAGSLGAARLHRFVLDPATGRASEQQLDDRTTEFPRVDDRRVGLRHRYAWLASRDEDNDGDAAAGSSITRFDAVAGTVERHELGAGRIPGEAVFVADPDRSGEDEGWVLSLVYDAAAGTSDLIILDAADPAAAPVATVHLPVRVPFGFHGSWVPAGAVAGA